MGHAVTDDDIAEDLKYTRRELSSTRAERDSLFRQMREFTRIEHDLRRQIADLTARLERSQARTDAAEERLEELGEIG
jgi:septal ring factor EnvC (AmiA/AmiB activator)